MGEEKVVAKVSEVAEKKPERRHKKTGRPILFKKKMLMDAELLCQLGLTEENLATYWGVSSRTVIRWKKKNPQLCHAIEKGRLSANIAVSRRAFQLATEGNLGAIVFWLTNRFAEVWRDRRATTEAKAVLAEFSTTGEPSEVRQAVRGWDNDKKRRFVQVVARIENEMGGLVDREIEKEAIKTELKEEAKQTEVSSGGENHNQGEAQ